MRRPLADHGSSVLVAILSSAFGVMLLEVTLVLSQLIRSDRTTGSSATVEALLRLLAWVFIAIAVYVGAVVTANSFATIIAGRTRTIALLRLIGSSAGALRRSVAREGLAVGVIGAIGGAIVGTGLTAVIVGIGVATATIPSAAYMLVDAEIVLPMVAVVLTTLGASWIGSRRVLSVSPISAAGVSIEQTLEQATSRHGRNRTSLVLLIVGGALLLLAIVIGLVTPLAVLVGVVGGILSFSGVVVGAQRIMPMALRLVGRAFGSSATARLASENAVRYPERSTRTTIGLVIGVTLVTMFAVAVQTFENMVRQAQAAQPEVYQGTDQALQVVVTIFSVLMGFSALIAAVGMVNALSLSVLQRTRELGLLRALGFTARQVRSMVLAESAQLTIAAVLVGLLLGTFYGWVGAQSLLGSMMGLVPPGIPFAIIGVIVVASVALIAIASVAPSRRATRITPVAALAVE